MSRNLKKEYIQKVRAMAPDGYKFDIANYIYNPSYDYDYPSYIKVIAEDENTQTIRRVKYFKYYDGSGEYIEEIYKCPKEDKNQWYIAKGVEERTLEKSGRFNLNKLVSFCC